MIEEINVSLHQISVDVITTDNCGSIEGHVVSVSTTFELSRSQGTIAEVIIMPSRSLKLNIRAQTVMNNYIGEIDFTERKSLVS